MAKKKAMKKKRILSDYEKLQKKHKLPGLHELEQEYEVAAYIKDLEGLNLQYQMLLEIRRRMAERFNSWINYLHALVFPNQGSMIDMKESEQFNEDEKNLINDLLNKLMFMNRVAVRLDLLSSEQEEAKYIRVYHRIWLDVKNGIRYIVDKNVEAWRRDARSLPEPEEHLPYYG